MGYGDMGHLILIANEHLRATEYMNTYPHYRGVKFIQKCLPGPRSAPTAPVLFHNHDQPSPKHLKISLDAPTHLKYPNTFACDHYDVVCSDMFKKLKVVRRWWIAE
jgi:hypothetical protein